MFKRIAVLALTLASFASADTVYVTAHGKTFHTDRNCMSLAKSANILQTDGKAAVDHGLHECGICAHRHAKGGRAAAKPDNSTFAKAVK